MSTFSSGLVSAGWEGLVSSGFGVFGWGVGLVSSGFGVSGWGVGLTSSGFGVGVVASLVPTAITLFTGCFVIVFSRTLLDCLPLIVDTSV